MRKRGPRARAPEETAEIGRRDPLRRLGGGETPAERIERAEREERERPERILDRIGRSPRSPESRS